MNYNYNYQPDREVYLDFGAATPIAPEVLVAMEPYWTERFYNPSAPYAPARATKDALEDARALLAHLLGARPDAITLTAGATEATNLAFAAIPDADGHVLTDAIEHQSVLACVANHPHTIVPVRSDGRVDPTQIAQALLPQTELVSIELANGEIGTIQPIRDIARVIADERARRLIAGESRPIWLHVDASQAAGALSLNVSSLGCDMMTLSAAKVYGPKQVGLLWAAAHVRLRPLIVGGGQESGIRSGTENVAGTIGFACALELAVARRSQEVSRLRALRDRMAKRLLADLPQALISGPRNPKRRLPGLLHIAFPSLDAQRLLIGLERCGIYVGTGSACAASRMQESHVLRAIGMPHEAIKGSLRITIGRPTAVEDIDYAAKRIIEVARSEAARVGSVGYDSGGSR